MIKITAADRYFSLCVRERASWTCERCGVKYQPPTPALHCAHWHSRGNWSVRFDPSNALALCYGCHVQTGKERDRDHRPLMLKIMGDLEIDRLAFDKNRPANGIKRAQAAIAKHYREQYAHMQTMRAVGFVGRLEFEKWEP